MKRFSYLSVIAAMLVLPMVTQAQPTRVEQFALGTQITKSIVREYTFPVSISYIETATAHLFAYNDGSQNLTLVPINSSYSVNDFVLDGGHVIFCGSDNNGAIMGEFDITSFFSINQAYGVTNSPFYSQSPQGVNSTVTSLNKIVVFEENGVGEWVAIGQNAVGNYCVVDLKFAPSTWTCRVGELDALYNENLLDITLTDGYVVTAGIANWGRYYPGVRIYDKSDIFQNGGIQDEISFVYDFKDQSNNSIRYDVSFDYIQLVLSSVRNDEYFMLGANWVSQTGQNLTFPYGLYVGIFKIQPTGPNSKFIDQTGALIPYSYYVGTEKLRGMTSLGSLSSNVTNEFFYLLQEGQCDGLLSTESMVYNLTFNKLNGSQPIPVKYSHDTKYLSIDGFHNNSQYVMNGYDLNTNQKLTFFERYSPTGGLCMPETTDTCFTVETEEKPHSKPFSVITIPMTMTGMTGGEPQRVRGDVQCVSKEEQPNMEEER